MYLPSFFATKCLVCLTEIAFCTEIASRVFRSTIRIYENQIKLFYFLNSFFEETDLALMQYLNGKELLILSKTVTKRILHVWYFLLVLHIYSIWGGHEGFYITYLPERLPTFAPSWEIQSVMLYVLLTRIFPRFSGLVLIRTTSTLYLNRLLWDIYEPRKLS